MYNIRMSQNFKCSIPCLISRIILLQLGLPIPKKVMATNTTGVFSSIVGREQQDVVSSR